MPGELSFQDWLGGSTQQAALVPTAAPTSTLDQLYTDAAAQYGLDPALLKALVQVESGGRAAAVNPESGATGLTQLMKGTAQSLGVTDRTDPAQAIPAAARLLSEGLDRYKGDLTQTLMDYHGGADKSKWGPKTQGYPDKIYAELEKLGAQPSVPQAAPTTPVQVAQLGETAVQTPAAGEPISFSDWAAKQAEAPTTTPTPPTPDMSEGAPVVRQKNWWGPGAQLANATLLGGGVPLSAAVQTAQAAAGPLSEAANPIDFKNRLAQVIGQVPEVFGKGMESARGARERYMAESPMTALSADIAGSMIPVGIGAKAVMRAAEPAVAAISAASPVAANVLKFLSGQAGEGAKGVGNMLLRQGSRAAQGTAYGVPTAAATAALSDKPIGEQLETAALLSGPVNVATQPLIKAALAPLSAKVLPQIAETAKRAVDYFDIPMYAGNIATSPFIQKTYEKLGAHAGSQQLEAFTDAVLKRIGVSGKVVNPQVMNQSMSQIQAKLDQAAQRTGIIADQAMDTELQDVASRIASTTMTDSAKKQMLDLVAKIQHLTIAPPGQSATISGKTYQELTRWKGSEIGNHMKSSDPFMRQFAGEVHEVLDNALERTMKQVPGGAKELANFIEAKGMFRNWKTISSVAEKAMPSGIVNPRLFEGAVDASMRKAPAKVTRELAELGDIAKLLPESTPRGTAKGAEDLSTLARVTGLGLGGAAEIGASLFAPDLALMGAGAAGAGMLGKEALEALMLSPKYRNILIDRALGKEAPRVQNLLVPAANELWDR